MHYVNEQQIHKLLDYLPELTRASTLLLKRWEPGDPILEAALERIIHLALEAVTDTGSLLIDGFILRDAGSYSDIIRILREEQVIGDGHTEYFMRLVAQRKVLVQEYINIDREPLLELVEHLPVELPAFSTAVRDFIARENGLHLA
jgi:uncharacterized protein YutE (UPF0331/DUF86 family)